MSITSIGYINPNPVVGSVSRQAKAADATEQLSPASPPAYPYSAQAQLSGTGVRQSSNDTQGALLKAQEEASYWANYKVPFAAET